MEFRIFFALSIIALSCFRWMRFAESKLPQEEINALGEITTVMGVTHWEFDGDTCQIKKVTLEPPSEAKSTIGCEYHPEKDNFSHVVRIEFKWYNLPGTLPPQMVKLPYLREIDLSLNYLNGTIPKEWASMKLTKIALMANRLSGEIPKELGNITTLTNLDLEANQFSGHVPSQLGNLINLQRLVLTSNNLSGTLPETFALLHNLTEFRISDNSFSGKIPSFIQNWKLLQRLEMHASGLEGPIPSNISLLSNLTILRISDIDGPSQAFPVLSSMKKMRRLVLRNCNITGEIPSEIWTMENLKMLDVSFNQLVGEIPTIKPAEPMTFIFLTGNKLTGSVPDSILAAGGNVDLSYNNLTWQGPGQSACQDNLNLNLNLFRSSLGTTKLQDVLPCSKTFKCPRYSSCLHVNSGGKDVMMKENGENILYIGDSVPGGTAEYYNDHKKLWGFSSTGDFMDDDDIQNTRYTKTLSPSNLSELYATARVSPISLTYFHYCLENGNYTIKLHFAEIEFTNDRTCSSLGKRLFDIYIQEGLVLKDFNIEEKAHGAQKPYIATIPNVSVTDNILEIRLYYAGKGTERIPYPAAYGPLISAFSIVSNSKPCSVQKKAVNNIIVGVGFGISAVCLVLMIVVGILWWKRFFKGIIRTEKGVDGQYNQTGTYTLEQIRAATNDFSPANKIGEGGFGPVYKGQLSDGTWVAVKQLSSKSRQGNREFLNEIAMISCLQHPNLVKLHGFCIENNQLMLVYEYMENNSLAHALFSSENQLKLDWSTRHRICIGIAKGLAFLHEESRLKIVHRDIKSTNVLLDGNLNPKISDFGLARLDEEEETHISTKVAGTVGYMAPEYALWGHLSYKADVYSYGIVVLEIVSGKNNKSYMPSDDCLCLLDKAFHLQSTENIMELVDERLGLEVNPTEAENMLKVALLCTNVSPSLRPTMSAVVNMLEEKMSIPDVIPETFFREDLRFRAIRDIYQHGKNQSLTSSKTGSLIGYSVPTSSSVSGNDMHEICSKS